MKTEYIPPHDEQLEALAYGVCRQLAESQPDFMKHEIRDGFTKFLKVIIHIRVQQLNREADPSQSAA